MSFFRKAARAVGEFLQEGEVASCSALPTGREVVVGYGDNGRRFCQNDSCPNIVAGRRGLGSENKKCGTVVSTRVVRWRVC